MATRHRESGQVWATFLICLAAVMAMAAIVADLAPAFTAKAAQRGVLDRIEQELSMPYSMLLDSQGASGDDASAMGVNTGRKVAQRAVAAARDAGFAGTVEVWFYEPTEGSRVDVFGSPDGKIDADDRLWAWCVRLSEERATALSGFTGTPAIGIVTETAGAANPYARGRVYRSGYAQNAAYSARVYTSSSGDGLDSMEGRAYSYEAETTPQALKDAFASAYATLRSAD